MKSFRLIRTQPASASYNMALDAMIFNRYLQDGIPVLRVYRWRSPSFTCGFSQEPAKELDLARCASDRVEVVRRMTGGGILFHDQEISYSFVCDKQDAGEPGTVLVSYREICGFLIGFYGSLGLNASFALESRAFWKKCAPHELCSASHEKYDLVINGRKIGGNAQKRARRAVFQHGSVPVRIDWDMVRVYVPSLPHDITDSATSLSEELAHVPAYEVLEQKLIAAFGRTFEADFIEEETVCETSLA